MELRSIKENEKKEYPKLKEVKSKKLKKCIPSKWSKIGITSFMLGLILKSNVYANTEIDLEGATTVHEKIVPDYVSSLILGVFYASIIRNSNNCSNFNYKKIKEKK